MSHTEYILANARVVTENHLCRGSVQVIDGRIAAVDCGPCRTGENRLDMDGDLLLPGLIEVHTDNLEKHLIPRPGVIWPSSTAAILAHDIQLSGAGITTVFNALRVGEFDDDDLSNHVLDQSVAAFRHIRDDDLGRVDHLIHLRCEVSDPGSLEMFRRHVDHPLVRLISVMDHTPGQRQWTNLDKYRLYNRDKKWTDEQFAAVIDQRRELQQRHARPHREAIITTAREHGIPLATHDDTTVEHVRESVADGIRISEFPTTLEAARLAHDEGMFVVMGAPNVVRNGSHSGNVSALELAERGLLGGLSSDYVPVSLLHAAFIINRHGFATLPEAVSMVSGRQAQELGLADRGRIDPGRRADLIRVRPQQDGLPVVMRVWKGGRPVA
ncbi:MAG: alpha-D-ribose 1-methylphosphonate 5-triphosphate diphosphatase [Deltaproteobacteria bacterium]|nr:alpha-D-ribose 1-methylphosphonate 5-triphosphate diphosphatase [Candidatus Anaeroferrophillacea bacterium]